MGLIVFVVAYVALASIALVAALALASPDALATLWGRDGEGAASPVVGAVFMALLALTVPHMALETLGERIESGQEGGS